MNGEWRGFIYIEVNQWRTLATIHTAITLLHHVRSHLSPRLLFPNAVITIARMLTQKEMEEAFIPRNYRDRCAALLVPLNDCRHASFGLPWKCGNERLAYQKCVADEYVYIFQLLSGSWIFLLQAFPFLSELLILFFPAPLFLPF